MTPAPSVTYDRLRWWIVAAALLAAIVCAASLSHDVDATDSSRPVESVAPLDGR